MDHLDRLDVLIWEQVLSERPLSDVLLPPSIEALVSITCEDVYAWCGSPLS